MPTQSAAFTQYLIGDETNTLTDISQYVTKCPLPRQSADANLTAFATGGGAITETHLRGAAQSQIACECLFDPALIALLARIVGNRSGSTFQARLGNNAAPQPGDPLFQGTYTLFGLTFSYNTNTDATVTLDLKPSDGGALVPGWGNV
ncbi:MAG: hypothetical protein ABI947_06495 [Chloroflexota bacterium]